MKMPASCFSPQAGINEEALQKVNRTLVGGNIYFKKNNNKRGGEPTGTSMVIVPNMLKGFSSFRKEAVALL